MPTSRDQVKIVTLALTAHTEGLATHGQNELRAAVATSSLVSEAAAFLRHLSAYLLDSEVEIKAEETVRHGYWLAKFRRSEDGLLDAWEYDATASKWQSGVTLTLTYWSEQQAVCRKAEAAFKPPTLDQLAAISVGVLEGIPVDGVRYPSPEHISGWWLTTEHYDGDVRSLAVQHLYHVTAARSDLARYLALPYGFRFRSGPDCAVWFDQGVAEEG